MCHDVHVYSRGVVALLLVGAFVACVQSSGSLAHDASAEAPPDAQAIEGQLDAPADTPWRSCNGTDDARSCDGTQMFPFDSTRSCFEEPVLVPELCVVCTKEKASASIGPVCGVDPAGQLYVFSMRPDLRLEAPGWRFGHRRDRDVYRDLEADRLTLEEREACDQGAALWGERGLESRHCGNLKDAGDEGG
jgi:hypothetical protein